ncbi:transcription factor MafB-like [Musca vetustissima]|uniref:transcription factor MafB-like n=1 Tax=Musca vetustissima TaxID=27455 RepID=UPI002AB6FD99|nr:transcription factor MafB-like [Musca vetustissima]
MKFSNAFSHIIFVVLCGLLTVLADSVDTRTQPQQQASQQHTRHNSQQHHHHNHHQHHQHRHNRNHNHHHQLQPQPHQSLNQQPTARSHSSKQHHLTATSGVTVLGAAATATASASSSTSPAITTSTNNHRQSRKLETKSQVELIDAAMNIPKNFNNTKLKRLNQDDFYNRAVQRRFNARRNARDEWAYNTYNVHTNTYNSLLPSNHAAGKGDDNSDDVEFVSATGKRIVPDWSHEDALASL